MLAAYWHAGALGELSISGTSALNSLDTRHSPPNCSVSAPRSDRALFCITSDIISDNLSTASHYRLQFDHLTSSFLCTLSELYEASGSGTMVVLWDCCRCPLNAHSGGGGLKSSLKGLADQRSVSSVNSAAAPNATDMLWQRSDAKRLTAESLMTPLHNKRWGEKNRKIKRSIRHTVLEYICNNKGNMNHSCTTKAWPLFNLMAVLNRKCQTVTFS